MSAPVPGISTQHGLLVSKGSLSAYLLHQIQHIMWFLFVSNRFSVRKLVFFLTKSDLEMRCDYNTSSLLIYHLACLSVQIAMGFEAQGHC